MCEEFDPGVDMERILQEDEYNRRYQDHRGDFEAEDHLTDDDEEEYYG